VKSCPFAGERWDELPFPCAHKQRGRRNESYFA